MKKDIVDKEIERVTIEQLKAEKKEGERERREEYVKEQRKKERIISLDFSDLGDGQLSLKFSPKEKPLRSNDKISPKTDEWEVAFYIEKDPARYFSKYEGALKYFEELYQKHGLERHRVAYIDERIAKEKRWMGDSQEKRENGIVFLKRGTVVSGIAGIIVAILFGSVFAGIVVGFFSIVVTGICAWDWWLRDENKSIRSYRKEIEKLKSEKDMSSGPW